MKCKYLFGISVRIQFRGLHEDVKWFRLGFFFSSFSCASHLAFQLQIISFQTSRFQFAEGIDSISFCLSVLHCRCSKCYSVPTKKRVRKRVPLALGLLSLPKEVLLCILQCLPAEDLLSVRAVSECTVTFLTSCCYIFIYFWWSRQSVTSWF